MPHLSDLPLSRAEDWPLDPALTMLNHGSFGSCPRPILEVQRQFQLELEARPVHFFTRRMQPLLDESRAVLAELIGADPADLVFVSNVTTAANAVLRSLRFRPGDEILVTDHDYNAVRNVLRYVSEREGVKIIVASIPLPITSPGQVVDAVLAHVTGRTRLAVLDHVTSPTALVFPIEELVRRLAERGVDTFVDGAHAPGMVPLDVRRIGAAYYGGNCHKWICAPKGAGFLHVRPDRQQEIQPPVISHGYNTPRPGRSQFQDAFDWPATTDPSAWFCVGHAIRWLDGLCSRHTPCAGPVPANSPAHSPAHRPCEHGARCRLRFPGLHFLMQHNHDLAIHARRMLCEWLGLKPVGPEEMLGSMAAFCLPDDPEGSPSLDPTTTPGATHRLTILLRDRYGIEVPVYHWPAAPKKILRISAQVYNSPAQYERLVEVLAAANGGSR